MGIRSKLFLWIGGLFCVAFTLSFFWQSYLTHKHLLQASQNFEKEIVQSSQELGQRWEKSVRLMLSNPLAELITLTSAIAMYHQLATAFEPSIENMRFQTWSKATRLLIDDKEVDFLQNTAGKEVLSLLLPKEMQIIPVSRQNITEDLSWIFFHGSLYMGIRCKKKDHLGTQKGQSSQLFDETDPSLYYLFLPEDLLHFPATFANEGEVHTLDPLFIDFYGADDSAQVRASLVEKMQKAIFFLRQNPSFPTEKGGPSFEAHEDTNFLEDRIEGMKEYNQKLIMTLAFSSFLETGISGNSFKSPYFPKAVAFFSNNQSEGNALQKGQVFLKKPLLNEADLSSKNTNIIFSEKDGMTYLVQTLRLHSTQDQAMGYLTVGFSLNRYLTELALLSDQNVFLTNQGRVLGGCNEEGKKLDQTMISSFPMEQIAGKKSGLVSWQREEFFFLQVSPFPEIDLHFLFLISKKKQFEMVDKLRHGTEELIDTLSVSMRIGAVASLIMALIFLSQLAKKMTKPIQSLALATKKVSQGFLNEVSIPYVKEPKDEVDTLLVSFSHMIEELKEKEKVRAVLNKVVSPEIASEILQHPLQLGGEERQITVFFADIRDFTHLTESMKPQDVIELLNQCMTKISALIELHHGIIDKYVGDEAMALFGFPVPTKQSVLEAIYCGLEVIESLKEWNLERETQNLPKIEVGIGIHTGAVVAGNMGAENRLNYTVLGSNVNLGSRLCSLAGSNEIYITEEVLQSPEVSDHIHVEKLPPGHIKGFSQPIVVYKVLGKKLS